MIVCDTNILIEFYKKTPHIVQELQHLGYTKLAISAITQGELYFGAIDKSELHKIHRHLSLLTALPVTKSISARFIELMENYCLSHKLSLPDAIIAATSIIYIVMNCTRSIGKTFSSSPESPCINLSRTLHCSIIAFKRITTVQRGIYGKTKHYRIVRSNTPQNRRSY